LRCSEHYLGSEWCRQERKWWISAQREHDLGHENRIAVARVWPTVSKIWPEGLVDRDGNEYPGVFFFDRARIDTRPQPFAWPRVNGETIGEFRDALLHYVGVIKRRLGELREELEQRERQRAELERLIAPSGQLIYLHGRKEHSAVWEPIRRELEDTGYNVVPFEPEEVESEPEKIKKTRHERVSTMSACDAVLLLGTDDTLALHADLTVIGRQERQEAVARSARRLPCGVVDTFGVLRRKPDWPRRAKNMDVDWFDASAPPWSPQIRAWLHRAAM
jgi:hypothetical protein